jgi:hypothetical protein
MTKPFRTTVAVAAAATLLLPAVAYAHPDHGEDRSGKEQFPGEGVFTEGDKHPGGGDGHLPPVQYGVELVGKGAVSPAAGGIEGRVADVYAFGDYAYLTSFRGNGVDECVGGVFVMDISDLSNPTELPESFIPASEGSYAGEGVQVITIGGRDVLIHQNETCPTATPAPGQSGGISLWDVTDPTAPVQLAAHAGDYTASTRPAARSSRTPPTPSTASTPGTTGGRGRPGQPWSTTRRPRTSTSWTSATRPTRSWSTTPWTWRLSSASARSPRRA